MEQGGGGGGGEVVEEASPISSRPPANFEELMRFSAAAEDGGGVAGGGSSSSGNRWPREETVALLRIRSDMDSIFRDATLKAPLWEDVSRKLSEFGYKRSAKKCKEKFENVQKYYKRTKESRGGRQHGKAYKFFSQLEALNTIAGTSNPAAAATATKVSTLDVAPLSVANPILTPFSTSAVGVPSSSPFSVFPPPPPASFASIPITPTPTPASANITAAGVSFSSHSSSTASGMGSDDNDDDEMDVDVTNVAGPSSRKRKRGHRQGGKMMEFFEGLVKQVLQKQAAMQRSFLDALEKTEQERTGREEAWRRQEMARLAREHELMAQDRAASASRDAAILSLIQKITGQSIQLPQPSATPPQPPPPPPPAPAPPLQKIQHTHHHHHHHQRSHKAAETSNIQFQSQPIMAIPQQQIPPRPPPQQQQPEKQHDQMVGGSGSSEPASSRWPKAEVLALINLRSGLEPQYQEAGPKGPLWEEISAAMQRMGYCRSAKRCKEKWENINKYYKKVKEGNKKRPEDAKTCPYFHRLDTLYRNKVLGGSSTSGLQLHRPDQDQILTPKESAEPSPEGVNVQPLGSASSSGDRNQEHMEESPEEGAFREGGETEKPEDLVRELIQQEHANPKQGQQQKLMIGEYDKIEEARSYDLEEDEDEDELDEEEKMAYEIAFQSTGNRGSNGHAEPPFLTMVQ